MTENAILKTFIIRFADPTINTVDYMSDLHEAVQHAGVNLYSRHRIALRRPKLDDHGNVVLGVRIPVAFVDEFHAGRHLRGISHYLLKKDRAEYEKLMVGSRLLLYFEQTDPAMTPTIDKLEATISFMRLLEMTGPKATDRINRILAILKETE